MPRPRKCRRVCRVPSHLGFDPADSPHLSHHAPVVLAVDEYEVVRLLDLEGLTQEECAIQMQIARTTVTGIYDQARRKIADALVNGRALRIEGGSYAICSESASCPGPCRHRTCCGKQHSSHEKKGSEHL